jgi:MEMO1 family protein
MPPRLRYDGGMVRPAAVAGSWYPAGADALAAAVDRDLARAAALRGAPARPVTALLAPHAGLVYSGPTAARAYDAARGGHYDAAVLVGPSHYVGFDGVAVWPGEAFTTPLGRLDLDTDLAARLVRHSRHIVAAERPHRREHSLEMHLPYLQRVLPGVPLVPLVMGYQTAETVRALGDALADTLAGARVLLAASTDLSHFFDRATAARLDGETAALVAAFDAEGLWDAMAEYPEGERGRFVMCGGGPAVSVMLAARRLGATEATVLEVTDSSAVSGDEQNVVGYMAAVFGPAPSSPADT